MSSPCRRPNGGVTLSRSPGRPSPIDRLPYDMLAAIFHEYMLMEWHSPEAKRLPNSGLFKWLRVSHVNKSWREVALHLRSLWSHIALPCRNPDLLDMLLSRSKNSPLHIRLLALWTHSRARDLSFDLIQRNSQRLATLEVQLNSDFRDPPLWHKFITEGLENTPLLTRCSLEILNDLAPNRTAKLELKSAPECRHIRHLVMGSLPFSIVKEFCRPTLMTLSITYGEENVSISALLSVLSTMSSLKELSVRPPDPFTTNPIMELSHTECKDVVLPRLTSLRLSSDLPGSSILLYHLVIPSTTNYEIEIGEEDPTHFLEVLGRKLQGTKTIGDKRPPLKCGQLTAPTDNTFTIVWRAWATDVTFEGEFLPKDTPVLCIRLSDNYHDFRPDVVSFFSNLALSEVETLHIIHAKRRFTSDSWHSFFTLTPNLQDLSVTGSSTSLRRIFQAMSPKAKPEESGTILIPQLHTLAVGYGARKTTDDAMIVEELRSTLEARMPFRSTTHKFVISGLSDVLKMGRFEALRKWVD
ncbi:hypothetical protein NLI96_g9275 [Meripilus lineatus]|uniref:F-box domain-containing protein n=1 Tax=Meripilus lineatus TaxID=2056292 RepID=A0AAD5UY11_9APHY|nr:hypothetical protein NLI96_g9275 [Physisporinus lineatus]